MNVRCEDCTHLFWVPGQAGGIVQGSCPNCDRPYRLSVPGAADQGHLHDMVDPSSGVDQGGNPLQEGMLGGWEGREVRDESFPGQYGKVATGEEGELPEPAHEQFWGEGPRIPWHQDPAHQESHQPYQKGDRVRVTPQPNEYSKYYPVEEPWEGTYVRPDGVYTGSHYVQPDDEGAKAAWVMGEELEPVTAPGITQHPDPWMDNEPGATTFPEDWNRQSSWWTPELWPHVEPHVQEHADEGQQLAMQMGALAMRHADELASQGAPGTLAQLRHELRVLPMQARLTFEDQWLEQHPEYNYGTDEYNSRQQLADEMKGLTGSSSGEVQSSLKTAEFPDDDIDFSLGMDDFDLGPSAAVSTHKFIVAPGGRVLSAPEPTTHEAVATASGQDPEGFLKASSLGQLFNDGTTGWFQHSSGLNPEELQRLVGEHFGKPVTIDPNLQPSSNEDRWGPLNQYNPEERRDPLFNDKLRREQEMMDATQRRRPFPYYDNPAFNRGGSRVTGNPYLSSTFPSWYEEALDERTAAGPGEVEVIPSPRHGLHNGVVMGLKELGATVNGRPVDQEWGAHLTRHYSPLGALMGDSQWAQNKGQPVILGHDDPRALEAARQMVETGNEGVMRDYHQTVNGAQTAEVPIPEGLSRDAVQVLGALDAYVNGQRVRSYWKPLMEQLSSGEVPSITVGAKDPQALEAFQQYMQTGSNEAAKAYLQQAQQPTAHVAAFLAPLAEGALAGGAAEGAGAAAGGGLMGGGMGGGMVSGLMNGAMNPGMGVLQGIPGIGGMFGGGNPQSQGEQGQPQQEQLRGLDALAAIDTLDSIPGAETNDPSRVDPHEMDDGSQGAANQMYDPDLSGRGAEVGPNEFDPDGPGMERFKMLLPLVQYYHDSEESGAHDPLLQGLHQSLEMERPGYLDWHKQTMTQKHDQGMTFPADWLSSVRRSIQTIPGMNPGVNEMAQSSPIMPAAQPGATNPGVNLCPQCGAPLAGNGQCAHCGYGANTQGQPRTLQPQPLQAPSAPLNPGVNPTFGSTRVADGEGGPKTREQFQAVAELLKQTGREQEIPNLIEFPEQYTEELAQVQQQEAPPQIDPTDTGQAPPQPPMGVPGAMPPGMGPGGPPTDPSQQMAAAVKRFAADNVAPRCPECGSHTTSLLNSNGDAQCSTCGNLWTVDDILPANDVPAKIAFGERDEPARGPADMTPADRPNVIDAPAAEQEGQRDIEQEQDPSLSWQDIDGQPLEDGKTYELHERRFPIPEIIQVTGVRPDSISYVPQGEYNLGKERELKREDRDLYDSQFVPVGLDNQPSADVDDQPEPQQATYPSTQPGETSDLSHPHSSVLPKVIPTRALVSSGYGNVCQACGTAIQVTSRMVSSTENEHECYRCGGKWTSPVDVAPDVTAGADSRAWLRGSSSGGGFAHAPLGQEQGGIDPMAAMGLSDLPPQMGTPTMGGSKNITRMAGKHYSPYEQREFIDEPGQARNMDRLNLAGTHYDQAHDLDDELALGFF